MRNPSIHILKTMLCCLLFPVKKKAAISVIQTLQPATSPKMLPEEKDLDHLVAHDQDNRM
jgi:hypothetical protein